MASACLPAATVLAFLAIVPSALSACVEPVECFPPLEDQAMGVCSYQKSIFACYSAECCAEDGWNSVSDRLDTASRGLAGDGIDCSLVCGDGTVSLGYSWEARIKLSLQMTATEFDQEREKIKDAIAEAADASSSRVSIQGSVIKPPASAEIDMAVDAKDKDDADLLASRLSENEINTQMEKRNLVTVTVLKTGSSVQKDAVPDVDNQHESAAPSLGVPVVAFAIVALMTTCKALS